jgi:hypothetical protein
VVSFSLLLCSLKSSKAVWMIGEGLLPIFNTP